MVIQEPDDEKWFLALCIYLRHPRGVRDVELAILLKVSRVRACKLRLELAPYNVYKVSYGRYSIRPTEPMIRFAHVILWRLGHELGGGNPHRARRSRKANDG